MPLLAAAQTARGALERENAVPSDDRFTATKKLKESAAEFAQALPGADQSLGS